MAWGYKLGYTAIYDGAILKLSVWIEKQGQVTASTALKSARLLDGSGNVVPGTAWADQTRTAGNFTPYTFTSTQAIANGSCLAFDCVATIDGTDWPLRFGMARP